MKMINQIIQSIEIFQNGKAHELFEVKCAYCNLIHKYPKNQILAKIKNNELRFCSNKCSSNYFKKGKNVKCLFCNKEIYRNKSDIENSKTKNFFCNHSCSAKFSNKTKKFPTQEQKNKISKSLISFHDKHGRKYEMDSNGFYIGKCVVCNNPTKAKKFIRKTCNNPKCYEKLNKINGHLGWIKARLNIKKRGYRSKSEKSFYDLTKNTFPDSLHNERMFNGYDADIIIPSLKIAIHWNGPWHYRPIISEKHFKLIQERDKNRYQIINNHGFTNYIIKDEKGIFKKETVIKEFEIFLEWIQMVRQDRLERSFLPL